MILRVGAVDSRHDFGILLGERGLKRLAVEIGTHRGEFADRFLEKWSGHLCCVDPYLSGYDEGDPASHGDRNLDYKIAKTVLNKFQNRVSFLRLPSVEASKTFPDNSLDFVYIDGKHRSPDVQEDLEHWYPKVRPGGLLAGHDVVSPGEPDGGWGREVQPVLFKFAEDRDLDVYLVTDNSAYPWSYYLEKP